MVKNNERQDKKLQHEVAQKTDNVLSIAAIFGLVACVFINAYYRDSVPDFVFWVLGAAISKDAIKLLRGK